jgi:hypothetical protein
VTVKGDNNAFRSDLGCPFAHLSNYCLVTKVHAVVCANGDD